MYDVYKDKCNIFIIYVSEAHAVDVWNIGESAGAINYKHKTIDDRIDCGMRFKQSHNLKVPMYYDNMNDEIESVLSAWPIRYYVIDHTKHISLVGSPDDSQYDVLEIFNHVNKYY